MQYSLGDALVDRDHCAPLREACAELVVFREPLAQPIESFGDRLALGERKRLGALIDLDPRNDPLRLEQPGERCPVGGALADRLVVEDHAADELLGSGRREEELSICPPGLLGGVDSDRVEPLLDRAGALVGSKDALPVGDDCLGVFSSS